MDKAENITSVEEIIPSPKETKDDKTGVCTLMHRPQAHRAPKFPKFTVFTFHFIHL